MAGTVFASVSMSLDGYVAPGSAGELMGRQWMELQAWVFPTRTFRERLSMGAGGETGQDDDLVRATCERTGANIMGRRMIDAGEAMWPEEPPFRSPVFVLTHREREPWVRAGGTTFHFVTDGIESALDQAREAADDLDVRVSGGAETIQQYLNAGLLDELTVSVSPVIFGAGVRLFDGVDSERVAPEQVHAQTSPRTTHLTYAVSQRE
ncbi:dihydrofolate reductase [Phycicoccus sp. BSK3Z-2]|uniref:Dihydrofolate reductase n=1 Tax=Phycicoccus avicenniae TaxID=2828860 RepID=A0A941D8Y6_9MICO|nr:dihydrofolate reductase family protein [Phycicoccus avicenniae]MBR7743746.1 dihydrofolate reductase [Phycicoccus avicenniae]